MSELEPKHSEFSIKVPNVYNPTNKVFRHYYEDVKETLATPLDENFDLQLQEGSMLNGASELNSSLLAAQDLFLYEISNARELGEGRDRQPIRMTEIEKFSHILLSNPQTMQASTLFLCARLITRASEYLSANYGPDFTETYYEMLKRADLLTVDTVAQMRSDLISEDIYDTFEKRLEDNIANHIIFSENHLFENTFEKTVKNLFAYVREKQGNKNSRIRVFPFSQDRANLKYFDGDQAQIDISFLKLYFKYETDITQNYKFNPKGAKHFSIFRKLGKRIIDQVDSERSEILITANKDDGSIGFYSGFWLPGIDIKTKDIDETIAEELEIDPLKVIFLDAARKKIQNNNNGA